MRAIGEVHPTVVKTLTPDQECGGERLLGMIWRPREDIF